MKTSQPPRAARAPARGPAAGHPVDPGPSGGSPAAVRAKAGAPPLAPGIDHLSQEALQQVARYFQVLSEPVRLQILSLLRAGDHSVGELADRLGSSAANTSRHLSFLQQQGFLAREVRGNSVHYRIAETSVFALCDLVCGNIARRMQAQRARDDSFLSPTPTPTPTPTPKSSTSASPRRSSSAGARSGGKTKR